MHIFRHIFLSNDHRTHFWKGTTQESFQQSLVEIGSVVSEEKIFFKFHPPFFRLWNKKKGGMKLKRNLLLWNYRANFNQTLLKWSLGGLLIIWRNFYF
jgi:hypothetical protein